jgi:hypothetical protein
MHHACVGLTREWHLNNGKPLSHIAFDLSAGFPQIGEVLGVPLPEARLVAIGAVSNLVSGNGVE